MFSPSANSETPQLVREAPKLRDLLGLGRDLLRRRQLKKALNNAQIALDFAQRSGEAPNVVFAARALISEIYLTNGAYLVDPEMELRGWDGLALLRQETTSRDRSAYLYYVEAVGWLRLEKYERAESALQRAASDARSPGLRARVRVAQASSLAEAGGTGFAGRLALAEAAIAHAPPGAEASLLAELCLAKATAALTTGALVEALDAAHRATTLARKAGEPEFLIRAQYALGKSSRLRGNFAIALRVLYEALDGAQGIDFRRLVTQAELELGLVYTALGNERQAETYLERAAASAATTQRAGDLFHATLALGTVALHRGRPERATAFMRQALDSARAPGSTERPAAPIAYLALLDLRAGRYADAQRALTEAALLNIDEAAEPEYPPVVHHVRALLADHAGRSSEAERLAVLSAARAAPEERRSSLRLAAALAEQRGDPAAALAHERAASACTGELLDNLRERQLPNLDMRAALREKEREIEELTHINALQGELIAKSEEVDRTNRELVQAYEELRQFAYIASHDLKEPLRQIGSYVSLIHRNYVTQLGGEAGEFFSFVTEGVARLNHLLDSLMHYTSIARLDGRRSWVDFERVVASVDREMASAIQESEAQLTYVDLPRVHTNGQLLRHVLAALMDNAVKFRRAEIPPRVHIQVRTVGEEWLVSVSDNGIGIDPAYADKVYVLFQRLHARSEFGGTGVGLAIAQKTVQRLGGRLWFEGNADGSPGTTFYFTLPQNATQAAQ